MVTLKTRKMKAYLITLMTSIAVCVFLMIYAHLNYVPPADIPEQQLPGIASGTFVGWMAALLTLLFCILLATLCNLTVAKEKKE